MIKAHCISAELVKAYQDAYYVIRGDGVEIVLTVDQVSQGLAALMKKHGVDGAAFLTAFNPYSVLSSAEENELNQNALLAYVHSLGLKTIAGEGGDVTNLWPRESSVLILGISLEKAESLADRYGQNAFLWLTSDDGMIKLKLRYPMEGSS
ncbi:DUF3293 domain-containing protein [Polynucleobacter sp. 73C-SIWE]|uniref:DUF3293 domain-containing protein n=1 Tax=Polynucleobacter sp. 73C-SIWE TaxID=2689098 RepID=UPI001C0DC82A|nr:DUF3293 domain-containing protein [Polynucleobacter sp. 73C-SIWE]MBU3579744.1 DUF3293 domain-containing protein [Polynucleobacter sp. 73C-SIWE]